ncbi:MAG TPA: tripartite tricarboxylate transporter substrate binding protein, partial [Burkholderiales bacterium]|nr:tripartite tricarboxylate transporter substrate binding protein [Burkholderiales bacterium]
MTATRTFLYHSTCAVLLMLGLASPVHAQGYPVKPIRMIVPFAPGGPNDLLARLVAQKLTEAWGQTVVIDNRGGAGGTVGMEIAAKLPPDGYALAMGGSSNLAVAASLYEKLPYDPARDFTPIINVAAGAYALAVNPSLPARNVKELMVIAGKKPGYLSYGSSGAGSMSSLAAELFKRMSRTEVVHVPYKGTAPALMDVVTGQIELMFADLGLVQAHAASGRLRLLGVSTAKRSAAAPQLPTIGESLPGYEVSPWFGVVAPAGLPKDIVTKLNGAIATALTSPDTTQRLKSYAFDAIADSPEHFAATIRSDIAK